MNPIPPPQPRPYPMINQIQHYAWGSRGEAAFIPHLLGIEPQPDTPYAELWMGAHPSAPSEVAIDGEQAALRQWIAQYPREILGPAVAEAFGGELPFLFKVLSTAEALSIQAHPDREQARALHARDPGRYLTPNHKPEVAIVLDSLTVLMGFKRLTGILQALERYPEIADFVGPRAVERVKATGILSDAEQRERMRSVYTALIERSAGDAPGLNAAIDRLAERLQRASRPRSEEEQLFLDLRETYTGADVGLLSIFLLNLMHLAEGQGVFIGPGVPHAYLKGNIVECMANSDNVVRAGLTPKFTDTATLVDILTYDTGPVPILESDPDAEEVIYRTPATEFQVARWRIASGAERREAVQGVEILLVTQGEVVIRWGNGPAREEATFRRGQSVLIPAALDAFTLQAVTSAEVFQASVPLSNARVSVGGSHLPPAQQRPQARPVPQ